MTNLESRRERKVSREKRRSLFLHKFLHLFPKHQYFNLQNRHLTIKIPHPTPALRQTITFINIQAHLYHKA